MPTSVHLPKPLLDAIDRRAKALHVSRNRLIILALERELRDRTDWSPGFFERLAAPGPEVTAAVDEVLAHVRGGRRSKPARAL